MLMEITGLDHINPFYIWLILGILALLFVIRYVVQILDKEQKTKSTYIYYVIENISILICLLAIVLAAACVITHIFDMFDQLTLSERLSLYGASKFGDTWLFRLVSMIAIPIIVGVLLFVGFCIIKPMIDVIKKIRG